MHFEVVLQLSLVGILFLISSGAALQCYQCDSQEDDSCPSWQPFDRNINALVDCMSFEARIPGTFCLKVTQQSPGWFNWQKQTRRCGSRSDTGVAWGCRWVFQDNGVWKETCYCEDHDGCNKSTPSRSPFSTLALLLLAGIATVLMRIVVD
jgi:hypothetical protein